MDIRALAVRPFEALARTKFPGIGGGYGSSGVPTGLRYGLFGTLPGTQTDWSQKVGDPASNYAVFACLRWIADNLPEPEPKIGIRRTGGKLDTKEGHPLLDLLDTPNPDYDGDCLLAATGMDYALSGNAYWLKERNNRGEVVKLYWAPSWAVAPRWDADGSQFRKDYLYRPAGSGVGIPYALDDVVHFQWALDRTTMGRFGQHRTYPVYRQIACLNEGATYTAAILENMGVPACLISPKPVAGGGGGRFTEATILALKAWWAAMFTKDNRGKPGVPSEPIEVTKLSLSPEELALDKILTRPELAVCMAFGIHPAVIYLGTPDPAKGFDNGGQHKQARSGSYQDCLLPMTKTFARTISRSLLPDFEAGPINSRRLFCFYDFSEVEALAEDANLRSARIVAEYAGGVRMRSEARSELSLPVKPERDDVFNAAVLVVPADAQLEERDEDREREGELHEKALTDGEDEDSDA